MLCEDGLQAGRMMEISRAARELVLAALSRLGPHYHRMAVREQNRSRKELGGRHMARLWTANTSYRELSRSIKLREHAVMIRKDASA